MMNPEKPRRSTRKVTLLRVFATSLCTVCFLALIFVLASLYVARTRVMRDRARAEKRQERIQVLLRENAQDVRRRLLREGPRHLDQISREAGADEVNLPRRVLSVALDAEGNVETAGRKSSLTQLRDLLESATVAPQSSLAVVLYVDPKCPFEHVARVQGLCDELGVGVAQIRSRDLTRPSNAPPQHQTADSRG
jgi:hypothetical protein